LSADNTIAIAKFPEGWRVVHAQAIDNIDYFPKGSKERKQVLKEIFGDSEVFSTEEEAQSYALELEEDYSYVEYGICDLGELESFESESFESNIEESVKKDEIEFFQCTCSSKNHLIIVRKEFWERFGDKNSNYKEIDISLEFTAIRCDEEAVRWEDKDFILFRFFKKLKWRLGEAFKILITGKYKVEDIWEPVRVENSRELRGVFETKRLGETLIRYAEDSEKFWKSKNL